MDRSTAPITDTLEFAEELERVGMERQQARVVARGANGTLVTRFATKADVAGVESSFAQVEGKVAETKAELKTDIAETKAELKTDIARVESEVAQLRARLETIEARLLWRFLGGALIVSTLSASIVKLL